MRFAAWPLGAIQTSRSGLSWATITTVEGILDEAVAAHRARRWQAESSRRWFGVWCRTRLRIRALTRTSPSMGCARILGIRERCSRGDREGCPLMAMSRRPGTERTWRRSKPETWKRSGPESKGSRRGCPAVEGTQAEGYPGRAGVAPPADPMVRWEAERTRGPFLHVRSGMESWPRKRIA